MQRRLQHIAGATVYNSRNMIELRTAFTILLTGLISRIFVLLLVGPLLAIIVPRRGKVKT